MSIFKQIQLLVFAILAPACLIGMEQGSWIAQDKLGNNILIEWRKITDYQKLLEAERGLVPVMAAAFQHEKKMAETVAENTALAARFLLQKNEEATSKYLHGQKVKNHTCFVVTVKDVGSDNILGFTIFRSKPKFEDPRCVQLEPLAIIPTAQGRGLSRILARSIFEISSEYNHIVLIVRRENTKAQAVYKALGFTTYQEHEICLVLEYKANI